jgi:hypothetical protein
MVQQHYNITELSDWHLLSKDPIKPHVDVNNDKH